MSGYSAIADVIPMSDWPTTGFRPFFGYAEPQT